MNGISIVVPIEINDANLISSNVPENDFSAWSSSTTYALGDRVILASTHTIYESLRSGNLNKPPTTEDTWWVAVRPTNRWAVFDTSNSTKTTVPSGQTKISYEISGSFVNSVGILNITGATSATVTVKTASGAIIYSKTVSLGGIQVSSDWWSWFFGDRKAKSQLVLVDLPVQINATIQIELNGGVDLSVGVILLGKLKGIGKGVIKGARVGIRDYSRKEKNDFGDMVFKERAFSKFSDIQVLIGANEIDSTSDFMASIRAKPCLFICGTYESLVIYGFFEDFDIVITYATHAEFSFRTEGLT